MSTGRIGRPPTDELAHGERRSEILRTAMELFTERGYAAISLGQIAAAVGVTKSALYNHFRSKESLYAEVLCGLLERIAERVQAEVDGGGPFRETLWRITERAVLLTPITADMDEMMRDVRAHLPPAEQARVREAHSRVLGAVANLMRTGVAQGLVRPDLSPDLLGYVYQRLVAGFQGRNREQAGLEPSAQLVDLVVDLFLSGAGGMTRE